MAHNFHCLAHRCAHQRLTDASCEAPQGPAGIFGGDLVQAQNLTGQHQPPGRRVDEQGITDAKMILPVGGANLVRYKPIGGIGVGYPKQSLGDTHQQHSLVRRQVVLLQESLDTTFIARVLTNRAHQLFRSRPDFLTRHIAGIRSIDQRTHQLFFIGKVVVVYIGNTAFPCTRLINEAFATIPNSDHLFASKDSTGRRL